VCALSSRARFFIAAETAECLLLNGLNTSFALFLLFGSFGRFPSICINNSKPFVQTKLVDTVNKSVGRFRRNIGVNVGGLCRICIFTVDCKIKTAVLGKNYLQRGAVGVHVNIQKYSGNGGDYFIALYITGKKHLKNA